MVITSEYGAAHNIHGAGVLANGPLQFEVHSTLRVILTSSEAAGLSLVGEVATITLQLANGAVPTASSFIVSGERVIDATHYAPIVGIGVVVADVTLQ